MSEHEAVLKCSWIYTLQEVLKKESKKYFEIQNERKKWFFLTLHRALHGSVER